MDNIIYWLWITGIFGVESGKLLKLIEYFDSLEEFYKCGSYPSLEGYDDATISKLKNKNLSWAQKTLEESKAADINIICFDDADYPPLLKNIFIPPLVLFTKGIIPDWNTILGIGIVGTRKCTEYGVKVTKELSCALSSQGVTIISGLAHGIDSFATRMAINNNAFNIAVLGQGILSSLGSERQKLMNEVIKNGLVISEYPPKMPGMKWTFPRRNRIIAGLSRGVLVTEAPQRSGALITANYALEENRDVFAVPGKIDDINSKGTNNLLKQGAKPVFSAEDILNEYNIYTMHTTVKKEDKPVFEKITKTGLEGDILNALTQSDKHIDELIRELSVPVSQFNTSVMMLELTGYVKRSAGNIFSRLK